MKRIASSIASWLIFLFFLIIATGVLILVPKVQTDGYSTEEFLYLWQILTFNIILFFSASFVGTLISKTLTEERDDGTFLIIISKPITRMKIWIEKMLAILIVMVIGFTLIMFIPLVSVLVPNNYFTAGAVFAKVWESFGKYYFDGFQIHLLIFAIFTILAYFISSKSLITASSIFVVMIIIVNVTLAILKKDNIFTWLTKPYVYIPVIVSSIVMIGISNYVFLHKSFT